MAGNNMKNRARVMLCDESITLFALTGNRANRLICCK
ncbi:hypothetical protein ACUY4R_004602 [Kosakonia sp. BK9b]